jgi:hypothetical protein
MPAIQFNSPRSRTPAWRARRGDERQPLRVQADDEHRHELETVQRRQRPLREPTRYRRAPGIRTPRFLRMPQRVRIAQHRRCAGPVVEIIEQLAEAEAGAGLR